MYIKVLPLERWSIKDKVNKVKISTERNIMIMERKVESYDRHVTLLTKQLVR